MASVWFQAPHLHIASSEGRKNIFQFFFSHGRQRKLVFPKNPVAFSYFSLAMMFISEHPLGSREMDWVYHLALANPGHSSEQGMAVGPTHVTWVCVPVRICTLKKNFRVVPKQGQQTKVFCLLNKRMNSWVHIDFRCLNREPSLKMQSRNGKDYFLDNF